LLSIDKSERLHIEFRVKEIASPTTALGKIERTDADSTELVSFSFVRDSSRYTEPTCPRGW
jgi:hypothetical protein